MEEIDRMRIVTSAGPIDPAELGATLMHEHVMSHSPVGGVEAVEAAARALGDLSEFGIRSLVDLAGRGRTMPGQGIDDIEQLTGRIDVNVVVGFAFYKDPTLTQLGLDVDLDELVALYRRQATEGIWGSSVRAGLYGEVGTSRDEITPLEELHLRAAARAHLSTGLAISTHCTLGTMALEQVAILEQEGADLSRVVLGHLDLNPDVDYVGRVLSTGVNIAFDTFGREWFDYQVPGEAVKETFSRRDDDRIGALAGLVARGQSGRIVLSTDMTGLESFFNPATHGRHGYGYVPTVVVPRLIEAGVGREAINQMLVENPARILAIP